MATSSDQHFLSQPGLIVIPVEHLSERGIDEAFHGALLAQDGIDKAWIELFDQALGIYLTRTQELASQTGIYWFPPRLQNICVVTDATTVRPYFQPFYRSSWLVYREDFDATQSNAEFAVFQLLQAERSGIMQRMEPVLPSNLSYFLTRTKSELDAFGEASETNQRPDASFFRTLSRALPWLSEVYHEVLRPKTDDLDQYTKLQGTGLIVPVDRKSDVNALLAAWARTVKQVADAHYARHEKRSSNHAREVGDWLRDTAPRVVVTGSENRVLWRPDQPQETKALTQQLRGISATATKSLKEDLTVVSDRSRAFLDAVQDLDGLSMPEAASADQNGLSYMHLELREVAYNVREDRMQRMREPAPPFERLMLGARTLHEWGHLAAQSGWVPVQNPAEYDKLVSRLGKTFDEIIATAPRRLERMCASSLRLLTKDHASPGAALAEFSLSRIEDYQANLVAQRFLSPAERDTYVRNNVRSLVHDFRKESAYQRLARYVYEFQYLRFSSIPDARAYFDKSTWFQEQYLEPGNIEAEHFEQLLDLLGALCDQYQVDESRFRG